jgi:hypothetical protein
MATNRDPRAERFDQVEDGCHVGEAAHAFEFGKHDAEAVLPEGIGGNQHAVARVEQYHRVRVMTGRGDPRSATEFDRGAGHKRVVRHETRAALAGRRVGQGVEVPAQHIGPVSGRYPYLAAVCPLQSCVAPAVIRMKMRVDQ